MRPLIGHARNPNLGAVDTRPARTDVERYAVSLASSSRSINVVPRHQCYPTSQSGCPSSLREQIHRLCSPASGCAPKTRPDARLTRPPDRRLPDTARGGVATRRCLSSPSSASSPPGGPHLHPHAHTLPQQKRCSVFEGKSRVPLLPAFAEKRSDP